MMEEVILEFVQIIHDNVPSFLMEDIAEAIRPRGLITRQVQNDIINFFMRKGRAKMLQVRDGLNERLQNKL
jgi:hypothetical protein